MGRVAILSIAAALALALAPPCARAQGYASAVATATWANSLEATLRLRLTDDALVTASGDLGVSRADVDEAELEAAEAALRAMQDGSAPASARAPARSDVARLGAQATSSGVECKVEGQSGVAACVDVVLRLRADTGDAARDLRHVLNRACVRGELFGDTDAGTGGVVASCQLADANVREYMDVHEHRLEALLHVVYVAPEAGEGQPDEKPDRWQWAYKEDARFAAAVAAQLEAATQMAVAAQDVKLETVNYERDCVVTVVTTDGVSVVCAEVLFHVGVDSEAQADAVAEALIGALETSGCTQVSGGCLIDQLSSWMGLSMRSVQLEGKPVHLTRGQSSGGGGPDTTTIGIGLGVAASVGGLLAVAVYAFCNWRQRSRGWAWVNMQDNATATIGNGDLMQPPSPVEYKGAADERNIEMV